MTVTIKEREIELKQSIRAMIIYENIMGQAYQPKGIKEILTFFYATLLASDKDLVLDFEEFIDYIDNQPELMKKFTIWITSLAKVSDLLKKD